MRLERRITKDGMVSIGVKLYSVPDTTRRQPVEVHSTTLRWLSTGYAGGTFANSADEVRILEAGKVVAVHSVMDGRGQRRIIAGHCTTPAPANSQIPRNGPTLDRSGDVVALCPLAFYDAVGKRLADGGGMISSSMPENPVERIRHNLVGLRMPRALEALEGVIQQLERGRLGTIEAIDTLLAEETTVSERAAGSRLLSRWRGWRRSRR